MVRVHEWKEFESKTRDMFAKNPLGTRFTVNQKTKTSEKDGVPKKKVCVTLRVTDGASTLTFETNERFYVKRISTITQWFVVRMASSEDLTAENALRQTLSR